MDDEKIRKEVRDGYAQIAEEGLCHPTTSCCNEPVRLKELSKKMGYTDIELESAPDGANLGLGCGNPVALASLKEGDTVVDLGSGAGLDCFLAAKKVSENGQVIGVDMTPEMIDKARENAKTTKHKNVEFRLGEIEHLPVADNTADVIISNCVINLSPNKKQVFQEAFRVLKPGGRLMVSDMVLLKDLPDAIRKSAHPASCVRTAIMKDRYLETIRQAGFHNLRIIEEKQYSYEDVVRDSNVKVVVASPDKTTQELKSISELEEDAKEIVKEILVSTASINVSAMKPTGAN